MEKELVSMLLIGARAKAVKKLPIVTILLV